MVNGYYPYGAQQDLYKQPVAGGIIKVNGRNGAAGLAMGSNTQLLALDEQNPIVWLVQTDAIGQKTITGYDLTPHKEITPEDKMAGIEDRLARIEAMLSGKSNSRADQSNGNGQYQKQSSK